MARRGFFAGLQHQARVAARERERVERAVIRNQIALSRQYEQAKKADERAQTQLASAGNAERKRLEKEAREAHIAAKEAEVAQRNARVEQVYDDLDSLLASTLQVDDYVDLRSLRIVVSHPPFRNDLEVAIPPPERLLDPVEPVLALPTEATGLASLFGKKKYAQAVEDARGAHEVALKEWRAACRKAQILRETAEAVHAQAETRRLHKLESQRQRYSKECSLREAEAAEHNRRLVELIANLGYGTFEAVQEYISIVLSNSVYPEDFQVTHEFEFEPSTAELRVRALVPPPSDIPSVKAYKYTKSTDEITSTPLSQKDCRVRYAGAVHQVALRSFHEVFESDRRGLIKTISLEVGTNTIDPATGQRAYVLFVSAASERESFVKFDLSAVVPALTLGRLGAAVSKNPYALVAAERSGVRRT